MERFYRLVARRHGETFDVAQAARLEVEWWRVDRWVEEGCDAASPLVHEEREALVRSYAALLAAVHRS